MSERVGEPLHSAGIPDALAGRQRVASLSAPRRHPAVNGPTASIPDALATGTAIFGHTFDNDEP